MHSHAPNEENIVVLFYDLLPEGLWYQQLFIIILYMVQYPLVCVQKRMAMVVTRLCLFEEYNVAD